MARHSGDASAEQPRAGCRSPRQLHEEPQLRRLACFTGAPLTKPPLSRVKITEDPAIALQPGAQLHFQAKHFMVTDAPEHAAVENWGFFEGSVLTVAFPTGTGFNPYGSAVMVAPGIAIGSMHVFEPFTEATASGASAAFCLGINGDAPEMWNITDVTSATRDTRTDLAIYSLRRASALPANMTLVQAVISTRIPAVGEPLTLLGFRLAEAPDSDVVADVGESRTGH